MEAGPVTAQIISVLALVAEPQAARRDDQRRATRLFNFRISNIRGTAIHWESKSTRILNYSL